jgi:hypothetical protein
MQYQEYEENCVTRSFTTSIFVKCNYKDQVKENKMGRIFVMQGDKREMDIDFRWESQKERDHLIDLDTKGNIILKYILVIFNGVVMIYFCWLRIGTNTR